MITADFGPGAVHFVGSPVWAQPPTHARSSARTRLTACVSAQSARRAG